MAKVKAAGIYTRISLDKDGERAGVTRQEKDCRRLAERRGWPIAKVYIDDDVSAYNGNSRPQYKAMLADLEAGHIDAVVCWHLDRLHRQPKELEAFFDVVDKAGVRNLATVSGDIDLGTDDGRLHARILGAVARKESDDKSRRVKRKMEENAEAGRAHGGGPRPYGFKADKVTIDRREARLIREATKRILAGESLRSVARDFNDRDIPTVQGRKWIPQTIKSMLVNPRLAGLRAYKGEIIGKAEWKPIISEADHHRLVATLTAPSRRTTPSRARKYLLTGFLFCSNCDTQMVAHPRPNHRTYTCSPDHGNGCGRRRIHEGVEAIVTEALFIRFDSPALTDVMAAEQDATDEATLLEQIRTDEEKLEALAHDHYVAELITRAEFLKARQGIEDRIADTRRQLAVTSGSHVLAELPTGRDALEKAWADRDLSWRRAVIDLFIDKIMIGSGARGARTVDPNRLDIRWKR